VTKKPNQNSEIDKQFIRVGRDTKDGKARKITVECRQTGDIGLFWLGGFKSDMYGTKAEAVMKIASEMNIGGTRFDYSGHGLSPGNFLDGTISNWLKESLAVFDLTSGPQIIIGSSMGGWLALLLNRELQKRGENRLVGMILIAPALDMTKDLMFDLFDKDQLDELKETGQVVRPSDYEEPYILTKKLIDDGKLHLLSGGSIQTGCPVYILQGGKDEAVPPSHALKLVSHLLHDPVHFTLVPEGDHSLSRDQDIKLLRDTIKRAVILNGQCPPLTPVIPGV
jgi:esterase/lipase